MRARRCAIGCILTVVLVGPSASAEVCTEEVRGDALLKAELVGLVAASDGLRLGFEGDWGSGSDGDLVVSGAVELTEPRTYRNVRIESGGTLTAPSYEGVQGGAIEIRVHQLVIEPGGSIDLVGKGYRGGAASRYQTAPSPGAGPGGGGPGVTSNQSGGGAGHAQAGEGGYPNYTNGGGRGAPGPAYGDEALSTQDMGSGGGGSQGNFPMAHVTSNNGHRGNGGHGGGRLRLLAEHIRNAGRIDVGGGIGEDAYEQYGGGGGGGSGGSAWLTIGMLENTGSILALGGTGGKMWYGGNTSGLDGGKGSEGRIRLDVGWHSTGGAIAPPAYQDPAAVPVQRTSGVATLRHVGNGAGWDSLEVTLERPEGTDVEIDLLDDSGNPLRTNLPASSELGGLPPEPFQVRIRLSSPSPDATPVVVGWAVRYPCGERPTAHAGGPYQVLEGHELLLDGSASSDPDGEALVHRWSCNGTALGEGATASCVLPDEGQYSAVLTVSDSQGLSDENEIALTAINAAPSFAGTPPRSVVAGAAYVYDAEPVDPGAHDVVSCELLESPEDATLEPPCSVHWDTPSDAEAFFRLVARDEDGGEAAQEWTVATYLCEPEGCLCEEESTRLCFEGPDEARNVGACRDGVRTCLRNAWSGCEGQALPNEEACDGLDRDCDGIVDESCVEPPPSSLDPEPLPPIAEVRAPSGGCGCASPFASGSWLALLLLRRRT